MEEFRVDLQPLDGEWIVISSYAEVGTLEPSDIEGFAIVFRHPDHDVAEAWLQGSLWGANAAFNRLGVGTKLFLKE